jgi:hypothetical protein
MASDQNSCSTGPWLNQSLYTCPVEPGNSLASVEVWRAYRALSLRRNSINQLVYFSPFPTPLEAAVLADKVDTNTDHDGEDCPSKEEREVKDDPDKHLVLVVTDVHAGVARTGLGCKLVGG